MMDRRMVDGSENSCLDVISEWSQFLFKAFKKLQLLENVDFFIFANPFNNNSKFTDSGTVGQWVFFNFLG